MLATPAYLTADFTRDLDDLAAERRVLAGTNDTLAISFIDGAEEKIRHEIAKVAALNTLQLQEHIEKATRDLREIEDRFAVRASRQELESETLDEVPTELLALKGQRISVTPQRVSTPSYGSQTRNGTKQRRNLNPPPPSTNTYFYYQAASGLPIFLHPLDIRILLSHFSSYSSFPDTISVRVEACEEGTVNDDLRKRCKYLAHMPEGSDVVFIEADVSGVVGAENMKNFENLLKTRSARRKEKGRKDDRAKMRAEEKERMNAASWNRTPPAQIAAPIDRPVEGASTEIGNSPEHFPPAVRVQHQPQQAQTGVWGTRSFASTLHTPPPQAPQRTSAGSRREEDDHWDEIAWGELERSLSSGGRKKRSAKLVLNGGGAGRRR
jgi:hypothetical protein